MDLNIGITKNEWTTHQFPVRRTRSPADHTVVCCQNNACFAVKKMKHLLSLSICIILTKKVSSLGVLWGKPPLWRGCWGWVQICEV